MKHLHLGLILVVFLAVLPYINTFGNDFVWDDKVFIQDNLKIRSLSNIPGFFAQTEDNLYRPLRTTLYALTYAVWNDNKFGYHFNSLLWHTLSSVLVFLIIGKLTTHRWLPLVAASIFAVHPIHTERVTNMTGGFDLLGIFLMLLAFYLYVLYSKNRKTVLLTGSLGMFTAALFASEEALVLPLLVVLYEFVFNKIDFKDKKQIYHLAAFFVLLGLFVLLRFTVIDLSAREDTYLAGSFLATMLTMTKVFLFYGLLAFIPYQLTLYRELGTITSIVNPIFIFSFIVLTGLVIAAIKYRKKYPLLSFSLGWFFIALLPFSNVLPLQTLMADRYLYVPSIATSLAFAYILFKFVGKQTLAIAITLLFIFVFLFATVDRNNDWKDSISLWETTSQSSTRTSVVFSNLGFAYEQEDLLGDAEEALTKAIRLDSTNEKAHYNLGIVHMRNGIYDKAITEFVQAIENNPDYAKAFDSLGLTYYYASQELPNASIFLSQAEKSFERAIELQPNYYKPHSDLGILRARAGDFNSAIALFERSLQLNPWNHEAYFNLGILYEFLDKPELAKENFLQAVALQPDNLEYLKKLSLNS